jgi:glycosyltransferase involved in cell wall biosynthesis
MVRANNPSSPDRKATCAYAAMSTNADEPTSEVKARVQRMLGWRVGKSYSAALVDCSLIIATYKRPVQVAELLRHLADCERSTSGSIPAEVVVVDGSPDGATEEAILTLIADRFPFTLKYVRSKPGLTRQRNVGIDASSGGFVFFLDDDALPASDYFLVVRRIFVDDAAKKIGAVGGSMMNEWERPLSLRWRIRLALGIVPRIEPMRYAHCGTSTPRSILEPFTGTRTVDILPGCAFSFRREVFDGVRFSNFFEGYSQGEDMEISLRAGRRWTLVCSGDAKVTHYEAPGGRPASFFKGRMEIRNRYFIWRRYSIDKATAIDKARLLADFCFLMMLDLAGFLLHPWRPRTLLHGTGIVCGVLECALRPPEFDEASNQTCYQVDFPSRADVKELVR